MCSKVLRLCSGCLCWYLRPPSPALAISGFDLSRSFSAAAYLPFLSETKINENFSFREIEADEISWRFRVFFGVIARRDHSNKNYSFQIADGPADYLAMCADGRGELERSNGGGGEWS